MGKIIDGNMHAQTMKNVVKEWTKDLNRNVTLTIFQAGDNPASNVYVRNKQKACEEVGIESRVIKSDDPEEFRKLIISNIDDCDAAMVQLPLPNGFYDPQEYIDLIPPEKDADCLTTHNLGRLFLGEDIFLTPCTAEGVMQLLRSEDIDVNGKHAVIIGRSNIVGKPMAHLLLAENATVTICHSQTENLVELTRMADILVVAIGKPKFVTADMVKDGAVVIDVGINRMDNGKLCGDVDFDAVKDKVGFITPVPGGCGKMTVASLLVNSVLCAEGEL